jgi:hypothetical protein
MFVGTTWTTGVAHVRPKPSRDFAPIATFLPGTAITAVEQEGDWVVVQIGDNTRYIHQNLVWHPPTRSLAGYLKDQPDLVDSKLTPPVTLGPSNGGQPPSRLASQTWNRIGGLLARLAEVLSLNPALVIAVIAVESSGRGFNDDGRLEVVQ